MATGKEVLVVGQRTKEEKMQTDRKLGREGHFKWWKEIMMLYAGRSEHVLQRGMGKTPGTPSPPLEMAFWILYLVNSSFP